MPLLLGRRGSSGSMGSYSRSRSRSRSQSPFDTQHHNHNHNHNDPFSSSPRWASSKELSVTFIPGMMDGSCGTSPTTMQSISSMQILIGDVRLFLKSLACLPAMCEAVVNRQLVFWMAGSWGNLMDASLHLALLVVELGMVGIIVPSFLALPGLAFVCLCAGFAEVVALLSWPMMGKKVMSCSAKCNRKGFSIEPCESERWVYVNGAMTSSSQMHAQMMQLSEIFGRPMTGVHNRTMGLVLDVLCMLLANTMPVVYRSAATTMYVHLRECLINLPVTKVVIIANGTGCTVMSMALDRLHADLPIDILGKLEIYTFGCAASHVSNPLLTLNSTMNPNPVFTRADGSIVSPVKAALSLTGNRMEDTERVIPHIEHYALSSDLFACYGIIHHTQSMLGNTMCGREFIIDASPTPDNSSGNGKEMTAPKVHNSIMTPITKPGFTMLQYLDLLFPATKTQMSLLDERVVVDVQTAVKREFTAQGVAMQLKGLVGQYRRSFSGNTVYTVPSGASETGASTAVHGHGYSHSTTAVNHGHGYSHSLSHSQGATHGGNATGAMNGVGLNNGTANMSATKTETSMLERRNSKNMQLSGGGGDSVAAARRSAHECEGKTVRQLSRLWLYVNGARPVGEGVATVNGAGLGLHGIMS